MVAEITPGNGETPGNGGAVNTNRGRKFKRSIGFLLPELKHEYGDAVEVLIPEIYRTGYSVTILATAMLGVALFFF